MSDERFREQAEAIVASRNAEQREEHDRLHKEQQALLKAELKGLRKSQRESVEGPVHEIQQSVERYYDRKSEQAAERPGGLFGRDGSDRARQEQIEQMDDRKTHLVQSLGAQGIEEESGRQMKLSGKIQEIHTTSERMAEEHAEGMTRLEQMQERNKEGDIEREMKRLAREEERRLLAEKGLRAVWDRVKGRPFERE